MKNHPEFRMPSCKCLSCGYTLDTASAVDGESPPKVGDASVCLRCGFVMIFRKNMTVRVPTSDETAKIDKNKLIRRLQEVRELALPKDFIWKWPRRPQ